MSTKKGNEVALLRNLERDLHSIPDVTSSIWSGYQVLTYVSTMEEVGRSAVSWHAGLLLHVKRNFLTSW